MLGHLQSLHNHCLKVLLLVLRKERGELRACVHGSVLGREGLVQCFGEYFLSNCFLILWDKFRQKTIMLIPKCSLPMRWGDDLVHVPGSYMITLLLDLLLSIFSNRVISKWKYLVLP